MSSTASPAIDAAARKAAVDALGSVLVQAPAGSGKTTLLVQRYLRLLACVETPERILALTFTRRAAREMRERVLRALGDARDAPPDVLADNTTLQLARAALERLDELQIDLQSAPTRMRIETIDAFNAWLATQMPIAAGATAGLQILPNARGAYQEAARRALAYEAADSFGQAVERVLKLDDQRWRGLVRLVADMLPTRDRWLPLLAGHRLRAAEALDDAQQQQLRRHLDEDLAVLIERRLRTVAARFGAELLGALAPLMRGAADRLLAPDADQRAWRTSPGALQANARDTPRWRAMAGLVLTKDGKARIRLDKNCGFPPDCADKAVMADVLVQIGRHAELLDALAEVRCLPDANYGDAQWTRARDVAQLLVLAAAELDGVFRERGAIDFTAVSLAALRALGAPESPSDLALRLDYRLQHILVDEFQDTSSAQLSLVGLLTQGWQDGDGRSIFCVGDPMQSIYGFRQAEVRAFLELADTGIGAVRFTLERLQSNFRSAPALVEWTNQTFAGILPAHDDKQRGAIAFRPSVAREQPFADGGVECRGFNGRSREAQGVAAAVAAQLQRDPTSRIAILVRARAHARDIADALRARALVARSRDIEALQDHAVVRDILMLTRVLLHAGDRIAWLAVLRAPWCGLELADLLRLSRAGLPAEVLQDPARLAPLSERGRAACARLQAAVQVAYEVRPQWPLARLVENLWLSLGGAACLSDAGDLAHAAAAFRRLRELERQGLPDPAELQAGFEELFADEGGDSQIEIMTIHKAKGLEFDMVIVPALERAIPPPAEPLLLAHPFSRLERDGMVLAARSPVGVEADPLFSFLKAQQRDAAALEAQRLLYVACTRAKQRMLLTADVSVQAPGHLEAPKAFTPARASLLAALWPAHAPHFALPPEEPGPAPARSAEEGPRGGLLCRLPAGWRRPRGIAVDGAAATLAAEQESWPEFDWAGETARRVGSLVHAELQSLQLAGLEEATLRAKSPYFRRWLAAHGVPEARLDAAAARIVEALLAVRDDPRGQWILARGYQDDFREHALSGEFEGQILRAVFDRSFVDQGTRWVIDYKTSQHAGGARDEFLDREVIRYQPQLERYARLAQRLGPEPVRVGLYFPLMRAWREWEPLAPAHPPANKRAPAAAPRTIDMFDPN